jgi:hypothetical protein
MTLVVGAGGNSVEGRFTTGDAIDADAGLLCEEFFPVAAFVVCLLPMDPPKPVPDKPSPFESSSDDSNPDESRSDEEATAVAARFVSVVGELASCVESAAAKLFEPKLDVVFPKIPALAP